MSCGIALSMAKNNSAHSKSGHQIFDILNAITSKGGGRLLAL